jgi:CPA1 family monovalent cation:H+ antiporter
VVVAGLIIAYTAPRISTAASRRQTESTWPLGSYLLNGSLFVLIGLQVQAVARDMDAAAIGRVLAIVIAVWLTLLVVRFVFQVVSVTVIRLVDRRPSQRARRMSHRARVVSAMAGFRGSVSLALALSVPATLGTGATFAGRDEIVFVTAGVIVLTLLVQGPLLPVVVRWARFPADNAENELRFAEHTITRAAVDSVPELAAEHGISEEVRNRLTRDYDEHLELVDARANAPHSTPGGGEPDVLETLLEGGQPALAPKATQVRTDSPLTRNEEYTRLRLAVLDRKREVLLRLAHEGTIDDSTSRQIQTRLDIEELRITGIEPLG